MFQCYTNGRGHDEGNILKHLLSYVRSYLNFLFRKKRFLANQQGEQRRLYIHREMTK